MHSHIYPSEAYIIEIGIVLFVSLYIIHTHGLENTRTHGKYCLLELTSVSAIRLLYSIICTIKFVNKT